MLEVVWPHPRKEALQVQRPSRARLSEDLGVGSTGSSNLQVVSCPQWEENTHRRDRRGLRCVPGRSRAQLALEGQGAEGAVLVRGIFSAVSL